MNDTTPNTSIAKSTPAAWIGAIIGTILLMAILLWAMYHYTRPEDLTAARVRERLQFLQEVQAADAAAVNHYGWRDRAKGLVILPVERAMELTLEEWSQPEAARTKLLSLLEKALEQPPPPPEPVNPYE